jgi:hypothetical protein
MTSFSLFRMAGGVAFVNAKGTSQKRRRIVRDLKHHKLAGLDLIGNRRAINPQHKIERSYSPVSYNPSICLKRHML